MNEWLRFGPLFNPLPVEYDIWTIDKATIMDYIKQRNAVRRSALLPLVDEQKEFESTCVQIRSARWRVFLYSKNADYERFCAQVFAEYGRPRSWSDGGVKYREVSRRFYAFLRAQFPDEIRAINEIAPSHPDYLAITRQIIEAVQDD